jgi:single-strand DNA-binding protein
MASEGVNKVILLGNLGSDPELRYTPSGKAVCEMRLATNEHYGGSDHTEWHRLVAWEKLGERCSNHLRKGSSIYVEGSLRTRKWQAQDGGTRYSTEVIAFRVKFLANWGDSDHGGRRIQGDGPDRTDGDVQQSFSDDDLPF